MGGRDISERGCLREWGCGVGIARIRSGSIFSSNIDYCKWSRVKIAKGAIPGGDGILATADVRANGVAVSESREIERVPYLGQIKGIGTGRARKLRKDGSGEGTGY